MKIIKEKLKHHCAKIVFGAMMSIALSFPALGFDHSHSLWSSILQKHVHSRDNGRTTTVDYAAIKKNREPLDKYLASLTGVKLVDFKKFSQNEQIAFLVNVYNAFMISLVVDHYPIKSVKEIGIPFVGPWKKSFISILADKYSLDDIEHQMLRKNYVEPRIHFGVNCASVSCPPLRAEAFVSSRLSEQFDEQARLFFSNKTENSFNLKQKSLRLNPILKWFNEDFSKAGDTGTVEYVSKYLPELNQSLKNGTIKSKDIKVEYGNYNWDLNER